MTRFCRQLALALICFGLLAGCAEEQTDITLRQVPVPEGGSVHAVAVLDGADRLDVVAASRVGLFVHRSDSGAWQRITPRWPQRLPERHSAPLSALGASGSSVNFPHSEVFTAYDGRLWMVTGVPGPDGAKLMVSDNVGRTWRLVPLPETAGDEAEQGETDTDEPAADEKRAQRSTATPPSSHVRLLNHGDDGLYLINSHEVWRLKADATAVFTQDIWKPIGLEGVELNNGANIQQDIRLPTVLRHYLPATKSRPFELLTVLRERLFVYRRDEGASWQQVAKLSGADRAVEPIPGSDGVLMLTPDGLYRTSDGANDWQPIALPQLDHARAEGVALEVIPAADQAPSVVLLALDTGQIFRSVDLGAHWTQVRASDADGRTVTGFVHSTKRNRVWASSRGSGVLRSLDRGQTWHQINDELRATRVFDMGLDENDGFLLGTDAGLFRLIGSPADGHWQMLQDRATTSIAVEMDTGAIINGTASGAIVRLEPDGKTTTAEVAPLDQYEQIAYRPMRFRGVDLRPRAIVEIEARPDSQHVFAWSAREGPLMSLDGGISWTRLTLNPAFRSALEGSYLSNFTTDFDERMYLVTHALNGASPTQLWRSHNNGETWHAVRSFAQSERRNGVYVSRSEDYPAEVLFMARQSRFAKSLDGGNSWRDLSGPWEEGHVVAYNLDGLTHLLAIDTRHATSLVRVKETDDERPNIRTHTLDWPAEFDSERDAIRRIELRDGRVYITTPSAILSGALPDGQQKLPDGLAIIVMITSILVLTGIGFGVLKWKT